MNRLHSITKNACILYRAVLRDFHVIALEGNWMFDVGWRDSQAKVNSNELSNLHKGKPHHASTPANQLSRDWHVTVSSIRVSCRLEDEHPTRRPREQAIIVMSSGRRQSHGSTQHTRLSVPSQCNAISNWPLSINFCAPFLRSNFRHWRRCRYPTRHLSPWTAPYGLTCLSSLPIHHRRFELLLSVFPISSAKTSCHLHDFALSLRANLGAGIRVLIADRGDGAPRGDTWRPARSAANDDAIWRLANGSAAAV